MLENQILCGDSLSLLKTLPEKSVDMCVTSPPYFQMRDYGGVAGQIGLEETPEEYVHNLLAIFNEAYRVLKDEGTLWLNIGDSYAGSGKGSSHTEYNVSDMEKSRNEALPSFAGYRSAVCRPKSLIGIPWRLALAMQNKGWILRQDIIWAKPSCMPESVKDRFCRSHEYLFLFTKQPQYYFNHEHALENAVGYDGRKDTSVSFGEFEAIVHNRDAAARRERWPQRGYTTKPDETGLLPQHHGANIEVTALRTRRDVWWVTTEPSEVPHYAMFPQKLIIPCILCGCSENGIVLDPFMGSGTTAIVAKKLMRKYIGCEINPEYVKIAERRIAEINPLFD